MAGKWRKIVCRSHSLWQREKCETNTLLRKCQLVTCPCVSSFLSLIVSMETATRCCPRHQDKDRKGLMLLISALQWSWLFPHLPRLSPPRCNKSPEVLSVSGSFLQPHPVPKLKPDPSYLCILHFGYMVGSLQGTVPSLYGSELWMMNTVDHLVCEWHLNMLKVIWSHISFQKNISRSRNSLIDSPTPFSYYWGSSNGAHQKTLWLLTKTKISCLWFPVILKLFPFCPVTCKPKSPK